MTQTLNFVKSNNCMGCFPSFFFWACNEPFWLTHQPRKKNQLKLWKLLKIKVYMWKCNVCLAHIYRWKWETLGKPYGIKLGCQEKTRRIKVYVFVYICNQGQMKYIDSYILTLDLVSKTILKISESEHFFSFLLNKYIPILYPKRDIWWKFLNVNISLPNG